MSVTTRTFNNFVPNPTKSMLPSPSTLTLTILINEWLLNHTIQPYTGSPPFASDLNIALHTCLSRLLGNLRLFARDPTDIISEIALLCYTHQNRKATSPRHRHLKLCLLYSPYHQPITAIYPSPLSPYSHTTDGPIQVIAFFTSCPNRCDVCQSYHLFEIKLHHPVIPCLMYRCVYAIFPPLHLVVYIGQTGATSRTLNQLPHNHRFLKHQALANHLDLSWQILLLLSPHY